eukprot:TRINITY_DN1182_c0_g2_i3.p2 TRINITY_DN1182_c0_g2~~TRINITY_DN1182_c0_g2_i3.p2  ORF type:complete len:178 (+),score=53.09 TRINITY_DN1182_c0_g2_i3:409-942(+)
MYIIRIDALQTPLKPGTLRTIPVNGAELGAVLNGKAGFTFVLDITTPPANTKSGWNCVMGGHVGMPYFGVRVEKNNVGQSPWILGIQGKGPSFTLRNPKTGKAAFLAPNTRYSIVIAKHGDRFEAFVNKRKVADGKVEGMAWTTDKNSWSAGAGFTNGKELFRGTVHNIQLYAGYVF